MACPGALVTLRERHGYTMGWAHTDVDARRLMRTAMTAMRTEQFIHTGSGSVPACRHGANTVIARQAHFAVERLLQPSPRGGGHTIDEVQVVHKRRYVRALLRDQPALLWLRDVAPVTDGRKLEHSNTGPGRRCLGNACLQHTHGNERLVAQCISKQRLLFTWQAVVSSNQLKQ
jgi:hypothetical protein